jgi:DNA (cytosine-5)-methyltransferase 1
MTQLHLGLRGHAYIPGLVVVYFAGGGGTCEGLRRAGLPPFRAVNHWGVALAIHNANHPEAEHYLEDVRKVRPVPGTDILWQSPDCTHHSKAKGGKPRSNELRGLAQAGLDYATAVRPRLVVTECTEEFETWGPLFPMDHPDEKLRGTPDPAHAGEFFDAWVRGFRELGYHVEWKNLRAHHFGAPTKRKRIFVICRLDAAVEWPAPTHGKNALPFLTTRNNVIDWSVIPPSIFDRKKPYSLPTQRRIAAGFKKFGYPTLIQLSQGERKGQSPRIFDLDEPLSTVVAGGIKQGLVVAFIAKNYGGHGSPGSSINEPLDTVTCKDHNALVVGRKDTSPERRAQARAWLDEFVGVGAFPEIEDIGMRPLTPRELARATGLQDSYVLDPLVTRKNGKQTPATLTEQVRAIGNMVPPAFAEAIARANMPREIAEAAE